MSTATLTFDLSDGDDRYEFNRITKARDMALMLWELEMNGLGLCNAGGKAISFAMLYK